MIILHHSYTKDNILLDDTEAIRGYHVARLGWRDIGYHWIIEKVNGELVATAGRPEAMDGAHCPGMNKKSLGVCVVGDFENNEMPSDVFAFTVKFLQELRERVGSLPLKKHSDYRNTRCPGKHFPFDKMVQYVETADYHGLWSTEFIKEAMADGVLNGYPDGTFAPDKPVTRAELAAFWHNVKEYSK